MSLIDAWIVATPAVWESLTPAGTDWEYDYNMAQVGQWPDQAGKRVYHMNGEQSDIDAVVAALEAASPGDATLLAHWSQLQGIDVEVQAQWHDPATVVAAQPAGTIADPDYVNSYAGQAPRRLAGQFSLQCSEQFL